MKVRAYEDGCSRESIDFDGSPSGAARQWASKRAGAARDGQDFTVIVEPLDDEARAAHSWIKDEDGAFQKFRVTAHVSWSSCLEACGD